MSVLETQFSGDTILLIFPDGTGPALLSALIAGISLNRAHELNFSPGEVRLNVTLENIEEQLKRNDRAIYDDKIAKGGVSLKQLLEYQEKIVEEEKSYGGPIEGRKKIEKPKKESIVSNHGTKRQKLIRNETEISNNPLFNVFAVSIASLMASWRIPLKSNMDNKKDDKKFNATSGIKVESRESGLLDENKALVRDTVPFNTATSPELDKMEHLMQTAPIKIPEMEAIEVDGVQRAEEAMEEYLNQDDGSSEWLDFMSSMIDEE